MLAHPVEKPAAALSARFGQSDEDIDNLASWRAGAVSPAAVPFMPARVILQDFTGVPALVDPATMNPFVLADLVIDHSVQVDRAGEFWGQCTE